MIDLAVDDGEAVLVFDINNRIDTVALGATLDEAHANARELIAVLDAFVRPWTTDGSVPHGADVELLLVNGSVGQGYVAGDDWWLDRGQTKIPLAPDQVRGWRHLEPIKVERGRIVEGDGAGRR